MSVNATENVLSVSDSVSPLILLIIQKPLSFIHGIGFEPNPMGLSGDYKGQFELTEYEEKAGCKMAWNFEAANQFVRRSYREGWGELKL